MLALFSGVAVLLPLLVSLRPELTRSRGGKIFAFVALFLIPIVSSWSGLSQQMEHSKRTEFCLSCHVMSEFGRSLRVDDSGLLPAAHYQNNRIPREQACYTCHTNYTLFGDVQSKWRGLRHVYVQYLGTVPQPEDIRLYSPYHNRECLHCHAGARSFEEAPPHLSEPDLLSQVKANAISCLSSGCHDIVHEIPYLGDYTLWNE